MKSSLTFMERMAVKLGRLNEFPRFKHFQLAVMRKTTGLLIKTLFGHRVYYDNLHALLNLNPDRGVMFVGNHRTFFDLWFTASFSYPKRAKWLRQISFPVRSTFFYDNPLGMFINYFFGMGVMYPPIFRDRKKLSWNKDALKRVIHALSMPGVLVGYHPEGMRNKGDDPYQLLPGKPGVGQVIFEAKPIVIPFFINGVESSFLANVKSDRPIIVTFGEPIDFSHFFKQEKSQRLQRLFVEMSEYSLQAVRELMPREKELRQLFAEGKIGKEDPCWGVGKIV